jgi:DNA-binding transcriptional MocR family regulator
MSMELMVKAMKTKVGNPLRKLVLIKLADNANDMGECWPSYQHIADQCEIDRSTVRRHIKSLESQCLLRIENRDGPKGNSSNLYRITLDYPVGQKSTGVGTMPTGGVGPESTRTSHSFESVIEPKKNSANAKPEKKAEPIQDGSFDVFWKFYPKKAGKKDARKAWAKVEPDKHPEIMQSLAKHRGCIGWVKDDGQFIPNAATWLNAERWEDEVRPHVEGRPNTGAGSAGKPSLSEQVRQRNAERQAQRDREAGQSAQGSAELFTSGVDDYGRDFEGEFSRINDLDGKIVVSDDRPVWAQVD